MSMLQSFLLYISYVCLLQYKVLFGLLRCGTVWLLCLLYMMYLSSLIWL